MSYQLTSATGGIEAVIDDNCGARKFKSIARLLAKELQVKFTRKAQNEDTVDWNFMYKGHPLSLHYNVYNGVSICTRNQNDNEAVTEIASLLERKIY